MLLNIFQCIRQPHSKELLSKMLVVPRNFTNHFWHIYSQHLLHTHYLPILSFIASSFLMFNTNMLPGLNFIVSKSLLILSAQTHQNAGGSYKQGTLLVLWEVILKWWYSPLLLVIYNICKSLWPWGSKIS